MKKTFFVLIGILFGISAYSQEFYAEEGLYIGKREVNPSLSYLAPEVPSRNLTLMEVAFNKVEKREVNLVAVMERKRYDRESSYIELEAPLPSLSKSEQGMIQLTNDFRVHERGSNYGIYTGKTKIPAYKEMRTGLFHGTYSPYLGRSYASPYIYSPSLR